MPIYVYKCEKCNNEQEEIHSLHGPNYTIVCEKCKSEKLNKQVTRANCRVRETQNPCPS
jgi:putative FmdB family regulatory protein